MRRLLLTLALAALAVRPGRRAADPPKDFFFQQGDRIVFLGDSITEQYQYSHRHRAVPDHPVPGGRTSTFLNAGIGGDTANGGAGRFQSHVLAEKPTAVTINFGMNDGGYGAFNPAGEQGVRREDRGHARRWRRRPGSGSPWSRRTRSTGGCSRTGQAVPGDAEAVLRPAQGPGREARGAVRRPVRHHPGGPGEDGEGRPEGDEGQAVRRRVPHVVRPAGC